jgi:CubicO group peptidase (beta-lactamase class C family)
VHVEATGNLPFEAAGSQTPMAGDTICRIWMYETAADVTGVLIARASGMSFRDALRERICGPLEMKDTGFSVSGQSIGRLATAYERDNAATGERSSKTPHAPGPLGRQLRMTRLLRHRLVQHLRLPVGVQPVRIEVDRA